MAGTTRGGRWRESRAKDKAFALASCAVLAAYNNVLGVHPWHNRRYVRANLCATGAALAAAALSGLTPADPAHRRGSPAAAGVAGTSPRGHERSSGK